MKDALIVSLLSLLPRNAGARFLGTAARTPLSRLTTRAFVAAYGVDLSECEGTLADYPTLEALFTRRLKAGARPVDLREGVMVSPVDGRCAAIGTTAEGRVEVAPGRTLDVGALVGEPLDDEVDVAVLYLSPKDYHRVHAPLDAEVVAWRYIPGTLWPVFPAAVRRVPDLFARNERLTAQMRTEHGPMSLVMVGAFGVGRISTTFCDVLSNTGVPACAGAVEPPARVARGAELGTFHLGSTVVLVLPRGRWRFVVRPGDPLRMGAAIAELTGGDG